MVPPFDKQIVQSYINVVQFAHPRTTVNFPNELIGSLVQLSELVAHLIKDIDCLKLPSLEGFAVSSYLFVQFLGMSDQIF